MRKIGLITLFEENYGSILQCYSTKTFVESLGYECDVLSFNEAPRNFIEKLAKYIKKILKILRYPSFLRYIVNEKRKKTHSSLSLGTRKRMEDFISQTFHPQKVTEKDLKKSDWINQYDFFIAGSDQIWSPKKDIYPFRFLSFAPIEKRITLSVSFGISDVPEYNKKQIRKLLQNYKSISVREETGIKIVEKYSSAKAIRTADPTIIYTKKNWEDFSNGLSIDSDYILVHFLDTPNKIALKSINELTTRLGINVIAVGYNYEIFRKLKNFKFMDASPKEYIALISQAKYILTDSFHTSIFSINLTKEFFVFARQYSLIPQSSRIIDLLHRFNLSNRFITSINDLNRALQEKNTDDVQKTIQNERDALREYLKNALEA